MKQAAQAIRAVVAGAAIWAASAQAFPGWMGVYGTTARHTGSNPGQFTILMNEDYFGLEANVGIRVNGGDWAEHAMAYVTNASGNSVWTYTPAEPFPFEAQVEFYFHGYEGASHIYDSANTSNYHSGPLFWSAPADSGLVSAYPGNGYGRVRACALGGDLIAAHSYGVLQMNRKPEGQEWQALEYPLEDTGIQDFALASDGAEFLVAGMTGSNVFVRASADRGETFSDGVELAGVPANASFAGLGAAAGAAAGEFGVAYGVATNCCGAQVVYFVRSTDGGASWSAPVTAMVSGDGGYFSWLELGHNEEGWFLAGRNVWQGSSHLMYCATSTNGTDWATASLGGNRAWSDPDLSLSAEVAAIAADPYYDDYVRVWRHQGGSWTTQEIARAAEGGRTVRLGNDGRGNWSVFRQVDNTGGGWLWSRFASSDDGWTWAGPRSLPNPAVANASDSFTVEQAVNAGPKQFLLWHADYYVGTYQRMHMAQVQAADGYDERLDDLQWNGAAFTLVVTNVAPGATNHLEGSATLVDPVWTNVLTWRGDVPATNFAGTAGTQGWFRIRIER